MARKPGRVLERLGRLVPVARFGLAVASWGLAVLVAETTLGTELGRAAHDLEERIELQLRGPGAPADAQPERSHEEESFEPWELVSV